MKLKKIVLLLGCLMLSVGCASSTTQPEESQQETKSNQLYQDLTAEETYSKAYEYFNENVHYYKEVESLENNLRQRSVQTIYEYYNMSGDHSFAMRRTSRADGEIYECYGMVLSKDDIFIISSNDGKCVVREFSDEEKQQTWESYYPSFQRDFLTPIQDNDRYSISNMTRQDENGEIIISCQYSIADNDQDGNIIYSYGGFDLYINADGYLYKKESKGYSDDTFQDVTGSTVTSYLDINTKENLDFDEEVNLLKTLDGKDVSEAESIMN